MVWGTDQRNGNKMPNTLDVLANAPDFELTDTQGQPLQISSLWNEKIVVLALLRGFA
jgi:hypothetical protein